MDATTTITLGFAVAIVGCFISVWNFFRTYKKAIKEDENEIVQFNSGLREDVRGLSDNVKDLNTSILKLNFKTDSMCNQMTDISLTIQGMKTDLDGLKEKQIRMEARLEALEKESEG